MNSGTKSGNKVVPPTASYCDFSSISAVLKTLPIESAFKGTKFHFGDFRLEQTSDALRQFAGTILFVSHDRDFIDRVATRKISVHRDEIAEIS